MNNFDTAKLFDVFSFIVLHRYFEVLTRKERLKCSETETKTFI